MLISLAIASLLTGAVQLDPEFIASSRGDEVYTGQFVKLFPDGTVVLDSSTGMVTVREFVSLRRHDLPVPARPRGPMLITTTGDCISGRIIGGNGQSLKFLPGWVKDDDLAWTVPFSSTQIVWLSRSPADTPVDPSRDSWLADNRKRDRVRLRNGDVLTGTLDSLDATPAIRFTPEGGAIRTVPLSEVSAIAFNPSLARTRKPKSRYGHLVLRNGTRLDVTDPSADARALRGKTVFGQVVEIPFDDVVSLEMYQGKAIYLSDLKPMKVEQTGFVGITWPPASDRTVRGRSIQLVTPNGDSTFDKGLGTHPRTTLSYDLGGKYRRFEAIVGLDADTGKRGQATVRVQVDGKEQQLPKLLTLTAGPAIPIRVDIKGAKVLTLVIDFGPGGDVQADVNWGDARIVE